MLFEGMACSQIKLGSLVRPQHLVALVSEIPTSIHRLDYGDCLRAQP